MLIVLRRRAAKQVVALREPLELFDQVAVVLKQLGVLEDGVAGRNGWGDRPTTSR